MIEMNCCLLYGSGTILNWEKQRPQRQSLEQMTGSIFSDREPSGGTQAADLGKRREGGGQVLGDLLVSSLQTHSCGHPFSGTFFVREGTDKG